MLSEKKTEAHKAKWAEAERQLALLKFARSAQVASSEFITPPVLDQPKPSLEPV